MRGLDCDREAIQPESGVSGKFDARRPRLTKCVTDRLGKVPQRDSAGEERCSRQSPSRLGSRANAKDVPVRRTRRYGTIPGVQSSPLSPFATTAIGADRLPARLSPDARVIAAWLLLCCAVVFAVVVVGGVTRLTHSGLSITEWQPIVGTLPPMSDSD